MAKAWRMFLLLALVCGLGVEGHPPRTHAVSSGERHTCVLLEDGGVRCWVPHVLERDAKADLSRLPAIDFGAGQTAVKISVGAFHQCAVLDTGALKCWGLGDAGQLGYEDRISRGSSPAEMGVLPAVDLGPGRLAVDVACGGSHTCAVLDDGSLKCWGAGAQGQLGSGSEGEGRGAAPGEMGAGLRSVNLGEDPAACAVAVAAGARHSCVLLQVQGQPGPEESWPAWAAGQGQRADADAAEAAAEEAAEPAAPAASEAAAGSAAARGPRKPCARGGGGNGHGHGHGHGHGGGGNQRQRARVKCFGENLQGQLGYGDRRPRGTSRLEMGSFLPFVDLGDDEQVTQLSAAGDHSCALLQTGKLKCWGHGASGQLGQGDTADRGSGPSEMGSSLLPVDLGSNRSVKALSLGWDFSCALLEVASWGSSAGAGAGASLGNGNVDSPHLEVKCWGRGESGKLGDQPGEMGDELPAVVAARALALSSGETHACAVLADGRTKCWGSEALGEVASPSPQASTDSTVSPEGLRFLQANTDLANDTTTTADTPSPASTITITASTTTGPPPSSAGGGDNPANVTTSTSTLTAVYASISTSTTASTTQSGTYSSTQTSTLLGSTSTLTTGASNAGATTTSTSSITLSTSSLTQGSSGTSSSTTVTGTGGQTTTTTTTTVTPTVSTTATATATSWSSSMSAIPTTTGTMTLTTVSTLPSGSTTQVALVTGTPGRASATSTSTSSGAAASSTSSSAGAAAASSTLTSSSTSTMTSTVSSSLTSTPTSSTSGATLTLTTSSTTTSSTRALRVAEATLADSSLGFAVSGLPPNPVVVALVAEGQWAERSGVLPGDELLSINGQPVQGMSPSAVLQLLQESRPLTLGFASSGLGSPSLGPLPEDPDPNCSSCEPLPNPNIIPILPLLPGLMDPDLEGESRTFQVNATALDTLLGFSPIVLNASTILVAGVRPGLLADKAGVVAGDALLAINGLNATRAGMSIDDIMRAFQSRPLFLTFFRAAGTIPKDLTVPPDADCVLVTASAGDADVELGLFTAVMPPNSMRIVGVDRGRWAEISGMTIGDTVLTLNDKNVSAMAQREFIELMDGSRPLSIVFARCSPIISRQNETGRALVSALATMADTQLGFTSSSPPGAVYIVGVEVGLWADRAGMSKGDQLLTLNSRNVSIMSPNELLRHMQVTRPLSLVFVQGAAGGQDLTAGNATTFVLVASLGDVELGFTPQTLPPGPVRIMDVARGGWAERAGILVGDRLLAVNGESMSDLTAARLIELVQTTRPLALLFARAVTGTTGGTSKAPGDGLGGTGNGSSTQPPPGKPPGEGFPTDPPDEVALGSALARYAGHFRPSGCFLTAVLPLLVVLHAEGAQVWTEEPGGRRR